MRPATLWLPLHISESNDGFDNLCFYQKENYMLLCQLIMMMVKDTNSFVLTIYRTRQPNWEYTMWKFQDFLPFISYVKSILAKGIFFQRADFETQNDFT